MHGLAIRYYTKRPFGQTHRSAPTSPRCFWYNAAIKAILNGMNAMGRRFVVIYFSPQNQWICGLKYITIVFVFNYHHSLLSAKIVLRLWGRRDCRCILYNRLLGCEQSCWNPIFQMRLYVRGLRSFHWVLCLINLKRVGRQLQC